MNIDQSLSFEDGCTCRAIRYRMVTKPLFVHCCHCRCCQRETGASFALNTYGVKGNYNSLEPLIGFFPSKTHFEDNEVEELFAEAHGIFEEAGAKLRECFCMEVVMTRTLVIVSTALLFMLLTEVSPSSAAQYLDRTPRQNERAFSPAVITEGED